jgi:16S rRNA (cytosine967-C5)-methyltransferase
VTSAPPLSSDPTPARPLWRDLLGSAQLVGAVQDGASLSTALPQAAARQGWGAAQRGAAQALTYAALRHLGTARAALGALHPKTVRPPLLRDLLLTALALLLPESAVRYPAHTVVDQAVHACKHHPALRHAAGFVNALLRRFVSHPDLLDSARSASPEARWNHPSWWVAALQDAYPAQWQELLAVAQRAPTMTLRVNPRRIRRTDYQAALRANGLQGEAPADPMLDQALLLQQPVPVDRLPGFASGWVSVQDAAAQHAAALLDVQPGQRVLDACAAPGGKTAHVLERVDCSLLALDKDAQRLRRVDETLARLGLEAQTRVADATQPADWWDGVWFDRILLDAPCTASGISRRHPDIRWLRRATDVAALAATQVRLLDALWPLLRPGGKLLYVTCSVFPQEGVQQAEAFLARHTDAIASPAPGQLLPRQPQRGAENDSDSAPAPYAQDGFFYALFTKRT